MAVTVKSPPIGLRTITCARCSYILEFAPQDVQHVPADIDLGDKAYDYISCPRPSCGQRTVVSPLKDWIEL